MRAELERAVCLAKLPTWPKMVTVRATDTDVTVGVGAAALGNARKPRSTAVMSTVFVVRLRAKTFTIQLYQSAWKESH